MKKLRLLTALLICLNIKAQTPYTSFFTGDTSNVNPTTEYRICLMGGATEDDNAMKWFLAGTGGGDVVVIRVTGSSGYNSYLYSSLGYTLNSVETLVIPSVSAANHPYVRRRLREAEGVFIAGGNQNDYATFWKNSAVDSALNYLINVKKVPIGGTSAGMAIQGQAYYTAAMGSITSTVALSNPYGSMVTIGNNDFLKHKLLRRVITDTHYDNPDRRGRQTTFLARLFQDSAVAFYGLACDEYTAICIDSTGMAKVFGGFPTYDDNAYFIQPNCVLPNQPETCNSSQPLTWNRSNAALKVYAVKGTSVGVTAFNIKNWTNPSAAGGSWQNWYVNGGVLTTTATSNGINCVTTALSSVHKENDFALYPNPTNGVLNLGSVEPGKELTIYNAQGLIAYKLIVQKENQKIDLSELPEGIYFAMISGSSEAKKLVVLKH